MNLKHFQIIGPSQAKCAISFYSEPDETFGTSISNYFNNELRPIESTFRYAGSNFNAKDYIGIVVANKQAIPDTPENRSQFRSVSNVFLKGEDEIWVLKTSPSGNLIVKKDTIEDDEAMSKFLSKHLSSMSSGELQRQHYMSLCGTYNPTGGSFISFVDKNNLHNAGFVLYTYQDQPLMDVLDTQGHTHTISTSNVVLDHTLEIPEPKFSEKDAMEISLSAALRQIPSREEIINYYRKVYGYNQQFFDEFVKRVRSYRFYYE